MNVRMNDWMNKWEGKWMKEWNKWMNEGVDEWRDGWVSEWMENEWMNPWFCIELVCEVVRFEWLKKWQYKNGWKSNEWMRWNCRCLHKVQVKWKGNEYHF